MWTVVGETVAPVDGNWLLSTTAQSTAALVAIVGGFLVSRVIAMSSEKSGYERRLAELKARTDILAAEDAELHEQARRTAVRWFNEQHLALYAEQRGDVDAAAALKAFFPRGGQRADMLRAGESLSDSVKRAYDEIQRRYTGAKFPPADIDEQRRDGISVPAEEEDVYRAVATRIARDRRTSLRTTSADFLNGPPRVPVSVDPAVARQDRLIARREELQSQLAALRAEASIVTSTLDLVSRPKGLKAGLLVLTYFGTVGVVIPLVLMALRPVPDSGWARAGVVLAFMSGFVWLLGYIVQSVLNLARQSE